LLIYFLNGRWLHSRLKHRSQQDPNASAVVLLFN